MPRFVVQRTVAERHRIPMMLDGADPAPGTLRSANDLGVTWIRAYVSDDRRSTFTIYEGPDADTIRVAAECTGYQIESITPISVSRFLPIFFH